MQDKYVKLLTEEYNRKLKNTKLLLDEGKIAQDLYDEKIIILKLFLDLKISEHKVSKLEQICGGIEKGNKQLEKLNKIINEISHYIHQNGTHNTRYPKIIITNHEHGELTTSVDKYGKVVRELTMG